MEQLHVWGQFCQKKTLFFVSQSGLPNVFAKVVSKIWNVLVPFVPWNTAFLLFPLPTFHMKSGRVDLFWNKSGTFQSCSIFVPWEQLVFQIDPIFQFQMEQKTFVIIFGAPNDINCIICGLIINTPSKTLIPDRFGNSLIKLGLISTPPQSPLNSLAFGGASAAGSITPFKPPLLKFRTGSVVISSLFRFISSLAINWKVLKCGKVPIKVGRFYFLP